MGYCALPDGLLSALMRLSQPLRAISHHAMRHLLTDYFSLSLGGAQTVEEPGTALV